MSTVKKTLNLHVEIEYTTEQEDDGYEETYMSAARVTGASGDLTQDEFDGVVEVWGQSDAYRVDLCNDFLEAEYTRTPSFEEMMGLIANAPQGTLDQAMEFTKTLIDNTRRGGKDV